MADGGQQRYGDKETGDFVRSPFPQRPPPIPGQHKAHKPFFSEARSWEPGSCFLSFLLSSWGFLAPVLPLLGV